MGHEMGFDGSGMSDEAQKKYGRCCRGKSTFHFLCGPHYS